MSFINIGKSRTGIIGMHPHADENTPSPAKKKPQLQASDSQAIRDAYRAITHKTSTTPKSLDLDSLFADLDLKDLDKGKTGV